MSTPRNNMKKQSPVRKKGSSVQAFRSSSFLASDGRNLMRKPNTGRMKIVNIISAKIWTVQRKPILGSRARNSIGKKIPPGPVWQDGKAWDEQTAISNSNQHAL
ncbi:hypothetical protein HYFRA_00010303 [Hymenoscyphus fraxineus]|uniref:Uncharacterized protein n=1 Tax=Hymenoscyphus fraxineus TaxID=746836 RepID=A0A9N9L1P2_9HELO|nr:hypothetical protein HYFRA_00010303 [Hymenoscyphus fraxineus]